MAPTGDAPCTRGWLCLDRARWHHPHCGLQPPLHCACERQPTTHVSAAQLPPRAHLSAPASLFPHPERTSARAGAVTAVQLARAAVHRSSDTQNAGALPVQLRELQAKLLVSSSSVHAGTQATDGKTGSPDRPRSRPQSAGGWCAVTLVCSASEIPTDQWLQCCLTSGAVTPCGSSSHQPSSTPPCRRRMWA